MREWRADEKDSVKNMSAYADQNHAPSLAVARLELTGYYKTYYNNEETHSAGTVQNHAPSIMGV